MISTTLRIALIVVVLIYFIIIFYFLKKKAISLKYTLMWLMAGVIMAVFVAWPRLLIYCRKLVGIESNMNALFLMLIGFCVVILMALTSIVSGHTEKMRKLIQAMSLMEKRIRELEDQVAELEEKNSEITKKNSKKYVMFDLNDKKIKL